MIRVRWGFIIALAVVSLVALAACDTRTDWEKTEAAMAPPAPTDIYVSCTAEVSAQAYPYRDLAKQDCYISNGQYGDGKLHCAIPAQKVYGLCDKPKVDEYEATERWERFNQAVETYQRAKGKKVTPAVKAAPTVETAKPLTKAQAEQTLRFTVDSSVSQPRLTIWRGFDSSLKALTINDDAGKRLVQVDLKTGDVELSGEPNEAAKVFWEAVSKSGQHEGKVTDHVNSN